MGFFVGFSQATRANQFTVGTGDRPDIPDVIVLITEKASTVNKQLALTEARLAHQAGTLIYTIGVTNQIDLAELESISSHPHLQYHQWWTATDFGSSFTSIADSLVDELCRPLLGQHHLFCLTFIHMVIHIL